MWRINPRCIEKRPDLPTYLTLSTDVDETMNRPILQVCYLWQNHFHYNSRRETGISTDGKFRSPHELLTSMIKKKFDAPSRLLLIPLQYIFDQHILPMTRVASCCTLIIPYSFLHILPLDILCDDSQHCADFFSSKLGFGRAAKTSSSRTVTKTWLLWRAAVLLCLLVDVLG